MRSALPLFLLAQANPQLARAGRLEDFLRKHLRANTPYDRLVRDLFTSPEAGDYFTAYENKPENVAGSTARTFLGVRLECAQCHADRSGGSWTREQFWQYAAFFSRLPGPRIEGNTVRVEAVSGAEPPRIKLPEKDEYVGARFLDGSEIDDVVSLFRGDARNQRASFIHRPELRPIEIRAGAAQLEHMLHQRRRHCIRRRFIRQRQHFRI